MSIRILITGGTFDKEYDELTGTLFFKETHIYEMLRLGRCRVPVTVETIMMVDSLEMAEEDRLRIADACRRAPEDRIVITHGTDTLVETAAVLAHERTARTIILTGAMVPWAFGSSDGLFNLGSAISLAQMLPEGVYVAMNGRCFKWDDVRKDRTTGTFETVR